jgi:hypothetical protein
VNTRAQAAPAIAAFTETATRLLAAAPHRLLFLVGATNLLAAMAEQGATDVVARVGPSVCGRCYPVPAAMQEEVAHAVPGARSTAADGTPSLEIAAGVVDQLTEAGVAVEWLPDCSVENPALYSYRRDGGDTGRQAGFIMLEG